MLINTLSQAFVLMLPRHTSKQQSYLRRKRWKISGKHTRDEYEGLLKYKLVIRLFA